MSGVSPYGILLTGGASSRLGRDKASLAVGDSTLARRLAGILSTACDDVVEAGPGTSGLPSVATQPSPAGGPLEAVVTAWEVLVRRTGEKRPAVVLACDMPAVTVELLSWLADHATDGSVVPMADGHAQVLCARWSVAALEHAAAGLAAGERSPRRALALDAVYPSQDEWGSVCGPVAFRDVDTPSELAAAALAPPPSGDDWIALGRCPLPSDQATGWATIPSCGAVVTFLGTVRDHAEGRHGVQELTYEAYEAPALDRMAAVVAEARRRWPQLGRVAVLHRLGRLALGETAVVVSVSTGHRAEAFAAGEFVIDTVKASVPIWKYERWADGEDWGTGAQPVRPVPPAASTDRPAPRS